MEITICPHTTDQGPWMSYNTCLLMCRLLMNLLFEMSSQQATLLEYIRSGAFQ